MKFIDICSGIGGFRSALEKHGHECVAFAEIDKFAKQSYRAIYDTENEEELDDITSVTDEHFRLYRGQVDIITGAFLAKPLVSQGIAEGLKIQEEQSSFILRGRLKRSNHLMYYWKTSKGYSHTTKGELTEQSFKRWMNWGISSNGACLTANIGEFHKIENECTS